MSGKRYKNVSGNDLVLLVDVAATRYELVKAGEVAVVSDPEAIEGLIGQESIWEPEGSARSGKTQEGSES